MRYRNRIRIAPGLHLNLSGSGVSTTVGPKGLNVNLNRSGRGIAAKGSIRLTQAREGEKGSNFSDSRRTWCF